MTPGILLMALVISLLLGFLLVMGLGAGPRKEKNKQKQLSPQPLASPPAGKSGGSPCPLCGQLLQRGQQVHSSVFPGTGSDKIMEIYGCPFCSSRHPHPAAGSRLPRRCPVCRGPVAAEQPVFARLFESKAKKHVHVLGCPACYRGRSR